MKTRLDDRLIEMLGEREFAERRRFGESIHDYSIATVERARRLNAERLTGNSLWLGRGDDAVFPDFLRAMGWIGAYDLSLLNVLVAHQIAGDALLSHADAAQRSVFGPETRPRSVRGMSGFLMSRGQRVR